LVVRQTSEWETREVLRLKGDARFPGECRVASGETLKSLIARAGGLTPIGYAKGSLFRRDDLEERELQQMQVLRDQLRVSKQTQEVNIIVELQNASLHLYDPALTRDGYLRLSGCATNKADDTRICVLRANSSVGSGSGSRWFRSAAGGHQTRRHDRGVTGCGTVGAAAAVDGGHDHDVQPRGGGGRRRFLLNRS
jgi:hypothetical protein